MLLNYMRTLRNLNQSVRLYLAAMALLGFVFDGGIFSILFNLYLLRLGFGPEFIGQVAAAGLFAFSLTSLPAGSMGERWGYRAMMVLGLAMMIGGGILLPLAEFLPSTWLAPNILALNVLMFAGLSLFFVNAVPYVIAISPDERNQAFSMQTALLALAAFTGALGSGYLPRLFAAWLAIDPQHPAAYRYSLILAAALLLPSIWILYRIPRPTTEAVTEAMSGLATEPVTGAITESITGPVTEAQTTSMAHLAENGSATPLVAPSYWRLYSPIIITLLLLSIVRFFQVSGTAVVYTFFNVYMDTALAVPTPQIGVISAFARLIGVFAALITPWLITRWGAGKTVVFASFVSAISLLPLALIPLWPAASLGYIGIAAISSMRFPAFMVYATDLVPPKWRGTMAGTGEFAAGLSFAGLAFTGGFMAESQGFASLFLLAGAMTLVGTLLFYFWFILPRNKRAPAPVA